jgi:type IV pili sensor histidine kinase/response regulator
MPVLRYGRYTLVELIPEHSQQDLMQQIVDITLPPTLNATVGEALRYLLLRTGYQLCDHLDANQALDALPLPAAHIHLGPLTLYEALRVLVGPAWSLTINESTRRVCFGGVHATSNTPSSSTKPTT